MGAYNFIDTAILVIILGSVFAGLMRGFLKEVLSLCNWVVAALLAGNFAQPIAAHFSGTTQELVQSTLGVSGSVGPQASTALNLLSVGASFMAVFLVSLLIGSIVIYIVTSAMMLTGMSIINRLLGAGFGFLRGLVIVIIFVFAAGLTPLIGYPAWINSTFVPIFTPAALWVGATVAPGLSALEAKAASTVQGVSSQIQQIGNTLGN